MEDTEEEWKLLDLIYETAHDPGFWPLALEGLKTELDNFNNGFNDDSTYPTLSPNLNRVSPFGEINSNNSIDNNSYIPSSKSSQYRRGGLRDLSKHSWIIRDESVSNQTSNLSTTTIGSLTITDHEKQLIAKLTPHFQNALRLNQEYESLKEEREIASTLLDKVPFGIIFVSKQAKILFKNKVATGILQDGGLLDLNDGYLDVTDRRYSNEFHALIGEPTSHNDIEGTEKLNTLSIKSSRYNSALSILIVPYYVPDSMITNGHCMALFVATQDHSFNISEKTLRAIFGFTKVEARLAKHIASGISVDDYANTFHVSPHTVRSQLKTIFRKTDTNGQCELVKLVLTSPATFVCDDKTKSSTKFANTVGGHHAESISSTKQFLHLTDGRKLCYAEYGAKNGEPVILCHGSYGCRLERYPDDALTELLGIRLIVPDRSGYGESDVKQERSGLDWCDDVVELARHLNTDKFSLLGVGVGGYFAIACAYKIPDLLKKVVLVNSIAPFESISEFSGMVPHDKLFFGLARHAPSLFRRFSELTLRGLVKNIDWYFNSLKIYGGLPDKKTISNEQTVQHLKEMVCAASSNGVTGFVQELIMVTKPWEFDLTQVDKHITVYHGEKQVAIPATMSTRLRNGLPYNDTHIVPNEGNYLLFTYWETVLRSYTTACANNLQSN